MEIELAELFRDTTAGEWRLAAFWLPSLFWRRVMADYDTSPAEVWDLLEAVQEYHLFLVSATRPLADGTRQSLPLPRLRSSLILRDPTGGEQRVLKTKLPPAVKALVTSLATTVNQDNPQPFVPVVFPAAGDPPSPHEVRLSSAVQLIARHLGEEELALRWPLLPTPAEALRSRPRRKGELRRA